MAGLVWWGLKLKETELRVRIPPWWTQHNVPQEKAQLLLWLLLLHLGLLLLLLLLSLLQRVDRRHWKIWRSSLRR